MTLSSLIADYGYWAVFIGTFLEGETVLLLAGFAAHRGLLHLPDVLLLAFAASTMGDQCFYWVGRRYGMQLFERFPTLGRQLPKVQAMLDKYHTPLILVMRFLYGLRMAGPIAMGALHVPALRFVALNMLGAAFWAVLIGGLGYRFGDVLELLLPHFKHFEETVLLVLLLAIPAWWLVRLLRARLRQR